MKISRDTLQTYFSKPLPSIETIADAYTFHAFEIDSVEGDMLDVKVLPNRAADCSSEAGIATELSAILDVPLKNETADSFSDKKVEVSLERMNAILGSNFSEEEIEDVFRRLHFRVEKNGKIFRVTAPVVRTDIEIPEDVAEEVGRILGYDRVLAVELPPISGTSDQARYRGIERVKDFLTERGFTEISTQSFAKKGEIILANPLDKNKPALRKSLDENMKEALERAKQYAPLVLAPGQKPRLFEIGTVFTKKGEHLAVETSEQVSDIPEIKDDPEYVPKSYALGTYKPFSIYPFITRDIALWVPSGTESADVEKMTYEHAGELLARLDQFDRFEKEGRVSLAFRLVFQSMERTLTDDETNGIMTNIAATLSSKGYEVR